MLRLYLTDRLKTVLEETVTNQSLDQALKGEIKQAIAAEAVSWTLLKQVATCQRSSGPVEEQGVEKGSSSTNAWLHEVCCGSSVVLESPARRERSPALTERLAKLQDRLDDARYANMVADVTQAERKAEEMRNAVLPTSRLQLSFGLHIIVGMGTLFAAFYYGARMWFEASETQAALFGVLGMTGGLLLETTLFIIRSNRPIPLEDRMPHLVNPRRDPPASLISNNGEGKKEK